MEVYISLGIIILGGLVTASLQLPLGTLLLLYHASLSKNIRAKTKRLASSFIAGSTLMNFLLLGTTLFLVLVLSPIGMLPHLAHIILSGLLIALGIVAWFFYYRRKGSTELWVPRHLARYISSRAKSTNDTSEAFSLDTIYQAIGLIIFTFFGALPLLVLRIFIRKGRNVAEVQRWRIRNKNFFRFFTGAGFIILAAFIFAFVILKGAA